jgi:hypothetical protein
VNLAAGTDAGEIFSGWRRRNLAVLDPGGLPGKLLPEPRVVQMSVVPILWRRAFSSSPGIFARPLAAGETRS